MGFFTNLLHFPAPLAFLGIAAGFFGGMGLLFGVLTRIAAFGIGVNMVVAIPTVHRAFGFIRPLGLSCGSVLDWQLTPIAGFTILHQTIDSFGLAA
jgi:putative oxidoreductase